MANTYFKIDCLVNPIITKVKTYSTYYSVSFQSRTARLFSNCQFETFQVSSIAVYYMISSENNHDQRRPNVSN